MNTLFLTRKHQDGFTLTEFILALSFGSIVMLSAAQSYLSLRRNINSLYQHHRLDLVMRQVLFVMEKDLRRAGFCNGECQDKPPVTITRKHGEANDSCIIVIYDFDRNGKWQKASRSQESDYFGYRLNQNVLEKSRSSLDCQDGRGRWNDLLDPEEIVVTHFLIKRQKEGTGKSLFTLQLTAHWKKHPNVHQHINLVFSGYNA